MTSSLKRGLTAGPVDRSLAAKSLDEYGPAIQHHGQPSAVSLLHEEKIGPRNLACLADPTDEQPLPNAFVQVFPFICIQVLPEVGPNDARRYRVDTNGR